MYMYRFYTKKGFLFHPIHQNDFNEADAVSETYLIDERPDCSLTKIGLVVDGNAKTYPEFRDNMKKKESDFKRLCKTGVNT